ncbi:MAG: hypothetical protein M3552_08925 [Planctomycetota bacterium]|nr:hypothetical protein [Planctomycetaceae bacterium]MDQ3330763.1 hypothetical protein [Planctomycetota bacterium]
MADWIVCGVVIEGDRIDVRGVNPWDFKWASQHRTVELPHPSYPHQRHRLNVYEIDANGNQVVFAAGELSANVWGFYIPDMASA